MCGALGRVTRRTRSKHCARSGPPSCWYFISGTTPRAWQKSSSLPDASAAASLVHCSSGRSARLAGTVAPAQNAPATWPTWPAWPHGLSQRQTEAFVGHRVRQGTDGWLQDMRTGGYANWAFHFLIARSGRHRRPRAICLERPPVRAAGPSCRPTSANIGRCGSSSRMASSSLSHRTSWPCSGLDRGYPGSSKVTALAHSPPMGVWSSSLVFFPARENVGQFQEARRINGI